MMNTPLYRREDEAMICRAKFLQEIFEISIIQKILDGSSRNFIPEKSLGPQSCDHFETFYIAHFNIRMDNLREG